MGRFAGVLVVTADDGRRTLEAAVPEKVFQKQVEAYLKLRGFLAYHTYDSRRSAGGFPDIVAVHAEKRLLLFLELKTVKGKVSADQQAWLAALKKVRGAWDEDAGCAQAEFGGASDGFIDVRVLRPTREDWEWLVEVCA